MTTPDLGTQVAQRETEAELLPSGFQREEVHAALRTGTFDARPDGRGLAAATEAAGRLVEELGEAVLEWKSFRDEVTIVVGPQTLPRAAKHLRDVLGFALLSDISACDWLDRKGKRFSVSYIFTRLAVGAPRLRLQLWVDEGESVPSLIELYPTADWHERESYDFFGIEFSGRVGLRRLLMPDDWVGHPLRKDYPIGGEPVKFTNSPREL